MFWTSLCTGCWSAHLYCIFVQLHQCSAGIRESKGTWPSTCPAWGLSPPPFLWASPSAAWHYSSMGPALMLLPVVALMSLLAMLAMPLPLTSCDGEFLNPWKNFLYLFMIFTLAEVWPEEGTCWTRYVLVALGTNQASLMAVLRELNTCEAPWPARSHNIQP